MGKAEAVGDSRWQSSAAYSCGLSERSILQGGRRALIRFAQEAGFTVAEIHTLFEGFAETTPASARWQALAREKLREVDVMVARAQRMRVLLEGALTCGCLRLEDCARAINRSDGCSDSREAVR